MSIHLNQHYCVYYNVSGFTMEIGLRLHCPEYINQLTRNSNAFIIFLYVICVDWRLYESWNRSR